MREKYIKKIIAKMKEKEVDLMVASAIVFDEERKQANFVKEDFSEAEKLFKKYAPEIIAESAKTGLEGFDLDKFIEELNEGTEE